MRFGVSELLIVCVALCACDAEVGAVSGTSGSESSSQQVHAARSVTPSKTMVDDATFLRRIKGELIAARAMLDGAPISDLRPAGPCAASFVTPKGTTTVRWADAGDMAATDDGRRISLPLTESGRTHHLTSPDGRTGNQFIGAFGMLEMRCQGVR